MVWPHCGSSGLGPYTVGKSLRAARSTRVDTTALTSLTRTSHARGPAVPICWPPHSPLTLLETLLSLQIIRSFSSSPIILIISPLSLAAREPPPLPYGAITDPGPRCRSS